MRKRIINPLNRLVSHTTPDGKSRMGERDKLMSQFKKGTISDRELSRLASFILIEKTKRTEPAKPKKPSIFKNTKPQIHPKEVVVRVFGREITVSFREYLDKYDGFSIVMRIF
jgi:hypothetical protein